ncbi:TPA: hypothetical protein I8287_005291 [Kluyvera intermedia]|nr:hypothetical protein [Kluyvera intermedia]
MHQRLFFAVYGQQTDATGKIVGLAGGTGSMMDKHGMTQVIDCIEAQKDEDIGIIKSRV